MARRERESESTIETVLDVRRAPPIESASSPMRSVSARWRRRDHQRIRRDATRFGLCGAGDAIASAHAARLATTGNQALAQLGAVAFSVAIFIWSLALSRDRATRWLAAIGSGASALPVFALIGGLLRLDVGTTLVVLAEAVWNIAVGVMLIRDRSPAG